MFERELRTLSFVPRWVITRNIKTQSVAEHSFYVAVYAGQIAEFLNWHEDDPICTVNLLHAALWHDVEECFTGDIPGPTKRDLGWSGRGSWLYGEIEKRFGNEVTEITEDARRILKVANLLDEVFYKATEINMGNTGARHSYQSSMCRLELAISQLPAGSHQLQEFARAVEQAIATHEVGQDKLPENNDDMQPRQ